MKEILTYLYSGSTLSKSDAEKALVMIGQNNCSEIEITSFLTVYLMREITPEELAGFRAALVGLSVKVDLSDFDTIDVCGTGGDGKNTFNISTISSFVLAGAGIRVAKHGNYGVSSPVGSSNLLEYFGYRFSNEQKKLYREIEATGFTFMHAPLFHPAMKYVAPVRKGLKTKTFFNMLGPMINPAMPKYQLTGVYSTKVQALYDQVYRMTGNQYLILHGMQGYDEISLTGPVKIMTNTSEEVLSPEDLGFQPVHPSSLYGGETAAEAASIFMDVLMNRSTPEQKNVVLANVASGIRCVHPDKSWSECVETGRESLESGKALQSFKKLMEMQKEK